MLGFSYIPVIEKLMTIPGIMRRLCEIHERNGAIRMLAHLQPRPFSSFEHSAELHDLESFNRVAHLEIGPCRQKALASPTHPANPNGGAERLLQTYAKLNAEFNRASGNELRSDISLSDLVSVDLIFSTLNGSPGDANSRNRDKFPTQDLTAFFRYFNSVQNTDESPMGDNMAILQGMVHRFNEAVQQTSVVPLLLIPCLAFDYKYYRIKKQGRRQDDCFALKFLLARTGFVAGKYHSLQTELEKRADEENAAFDSSRSGWVSRTSEGEYAPYVTFVLEMLCDVYRQLETQLMEMLDKRTSPTEQILEYIRTNEEGVGKSDIQKALPGIGIRTIERRLLSLMESNQIVKEGVYRDTVYKFIGGSNKDFQPQNSPVSPAEISKKQKNDKNKYFKSEIDPVTFTKTDKEKPNPYPYFTKPGDSEADSSFSNFSDAKKKWK